MALFKNGLFAKKNIDVNEDITTKPKKKNVKINARSLENFTLKAIKMWVSHVAGRSEFEYPEFDLEEIKEASESDSYIKMSLSRISYLLYKAGWKLKGNNQDAIDYLSSRFRFMSFMTGKPMDVLFQEIGDDLTKYSNAFLLKVRTDKIPTVNTSPVFGNDQIIGGYFRIDPSSIRVKRDKNGNILKYEQGYGDERKEFKKEEIIHMYMDKDANNCFGTPRIIAALEDVKLLRKIEGNVVALIYRYAMPIYHWKIGLPDPQFMATPVEIDDAKYTLETSTLDGVIITNERTNITSIGADGVALDAHNYLKYFEERVFTALGMSTSQMGRGGAKQDSESMEAQIHDTVQYIQKKLAIFIENFILIELLYEGGFDPLTNVDDNVSFSFEEISLETKIKRENHEMLKYQSNVSTLEESRRKMGMKDSPDNEDRLYKNLIDTNAKMKELDKTKENTLEVNDAQAEHQKELAKITAQNKPTGSNSNSKSQTASSGSKKKVASASGSRMSKSSGPSKAVSTNNRPSNQYGTYSVKVREGHDVPSNPKKHKKQFKKLFNIYDDLRNDINKGEDIDLLLPLGKDSLYYELKLLIDHQAMQAMMDATDEINSLDKDMYYTIPALSPNIHQFHDEAHYTVTQLMKDLKSKLKKDDQNNTNAIFDSLEYRLKFVTDYTLRKAYWYSYVKTGTLHGLKDAYVIFNSEDDAKGKSDHIDLNNFSVDQIPAYHPFCKCSITFNEIKAGEKNNEQNNKRNSSK